MDLPYRFTVVVEKVAIYGVPECQDYTAASQPGTPMFAFRVITSLPIAIKYSFNSI